jgi:hypothetical protein
LREHSGWRGFWGDLDVFGVSGPGYEKPARAFAAQRKSIEADCEEALQSDPRYLEKLAQDRHRIDLRNQVPLADPTLTGTCSCSSAIGGSEAENPR